MIERLGKYEILRVLGKGAMGEVYLARHPLIGRDVALKTILHGAELGADGEARFRREAAAAGRLSHPNLVTLFDFDRDGDTLYLVMEYVKGQDLEALMGTRRLGHAMFLELLAQVCDGLAYAHRNGVLHRDIKPSNVRVLEEGPSLQAKVVDFGVARLESSNLTTTGTVVGTVSYLAPEYIQSGNATPQGDLWAVAVMLYEGLAGRKPFDGTNITTILYRIVSEAPPPLDPAQLKDISPSIRDVLQRALDKDPAARFPDATAFAAALRACKDPSWMRPLEAFTARLPRPGTAARRWKPLLGAAAACLVLGGLGFGLHQAWPRLFPAASAGPYAAPFGMTFLRVPAATFQMGEDAGEPDERPAHAVTLTRPYRIQRTPVTVAQFRAFVQATGYQTDAERLGTAWARALQTEGWEEREGVSWRAPGFAQSDEDPAVTLTWNDAQAFIAWLNRTDPGRGYRLPTEAEWEWACRAGSTRARYGDLPAIAWFKANSGQRTHPVGLKGANALGLHDMLGNAWQWCEDRYGAYPTGPQVDPRGAAQGEHRVLRGGSWFSESQACHAAARTKGLPDSRGNYVGFRLACNP